MELPLSLRMIGPAGCESLPPRPAGRLHDREASHTLGSGWPKASPPTSPRGEGPTAKSGRDSALARACATVKCCQNPGDFRLLDLGHMCVVDDPSVTSFDQNLTIDEDFSLSGVVGYLRPKDAAEIAEELDLQRMSYG